MGETEREGPFAITLKWTKKANLTITLYLKHSFYRLKIWCQERMPYPAHGLYYSRTNIKSLNFSPFFQKKICSYFSSFSNDKNCLWYSPKMKTFPDPLNQNIWEVWEPLAMLCKNSFGIGFVKEILRLWRSGRGDCLSIFNPKGCWGEII